MFCLYHEVKLKVLKNCLLNETETKCVANNITFWLLRGMNSVYSSHNAW